MIDLSLFENEIPCATASDIHRAIYGVFRPPHGLPSFSYSILLDEVKRDKKAPDGYRLIGDRIGPGSIYRISASDQVRVIMVPRTILESERYTYNIAIAMFDHSALKCITRIILGNSALRYQVIMMYLNCARNKKLPTQDDVRAIGELAWFWDILEKIG